MQISIFSSMGFSERSIPSKPRKTHCNIYHTWIFMKPFFLRQISAFTMHPAGRIHNPHHHYDPLDRIYGAARHIPPTKASLLLSSDVVSSKIHHLQSWSAMRWKSNVNPTHIPTRRCVEDANRRSICTDISKCDDNSKAVAC